MNIANAPCSWGVLEFDLPGESAGFSQVLDEMQETQYQGTELGDWGFMPTDPALLRQELSARSLSLVGAFLPLDLRTPRLRDEGIAQGLKLASLMKQAGHGHALIVLSDDNGKNILRTRQSGRITASEQLSASEWKVFAQSCELVARAIAEQSGLRTVYHPHSAGWVETSGEVEKLMAMTSQELLGLCLDTGHCRFAGGYPEAIVELYGSRIWHVHFKDCDDEVAACSRRYEWDYFTALKYGLFCELGEGGVDFVSVVEKLKRISYSSWIVVEQDILPGMGDPKKYALHNREYLKGIGI